MTTTKKTTKKTARDTNENDPAIAAELPDLWEQQPGETDAAYIGFCVYRDITNVTRSIRKAAGIHFEPKNGPVGATLAQVRSFERWSVEYGWGSRAAAYDRDVEAKARAAHLAEVIDMRKRHASIAANMAHKVLQRLVGDVANGIEPIDVNSLNAADLGRWMEHAVKIERLSRGEPDTIVGQAEGDAQAVQQETTRRILTDPRLRDLADAMLDDQEDADDEWEPVDQDEDEDGADPA